jgi:D-alanyl-D-alanine carboxypeptidase
MLTLRLNHLPINTLGIYNGKMPLRALFLHPLASEAFLADSWVCSDIFRSPESSLVAVRAGRGAQPPGFSAHNFGLAIDIDVKATMARLSIKTKADLDAYMENTGWFCHRRDHKLDRESWHYTFLGVGAFIAPKYQTIVHHTEARIVEFYGKDLAPDDMECQRMLAKLGLYGGAIDGDLGPLSKAAAEVFRRGWGLYGKSFDSKVRRTLALVSANKIIK